MFFLEFSKLVGMLRLLLENGVYVLAKPVDLELGDSMIAVKVHLRTNADRTGISRLRPHILNGTG